MSLEDAVCIIGLDKSIAELKVRNGSATLHDLELVEAIDTVFGFLYDFLQAAKAGQKELKDACD